MFSTHFMDEADILAGEIFLLAFLKDEVLVKWELDIEMLNSGVRQINCVFFTKKKKRYYTAFKITCFCVGGEPLTSRFGNLPRKLTGPHPSMSYRSEADRWQGRAGQTAEALLTLRGNQTHLPGALPSELART